MSARDRFKRWVAEQEARGLTRTAIAASIGCSESALCKILRDARGAGGRIASGIERVTGSWEHGPIRVADWYAVAA